MAFKSILIANRGEIAVRVIRTAQALGYRAIAVCSEADAHAPHVAMADEAIAIGPPEAAQSYLNMEAILDAAEKSGAEAIHPGYGFLSENADFVRACEARGLVFIGPGADAVDIMGNKAAAKRRMQGAGVPCVPGYEGEDQSDETLRRAAADIGFPIMVKAAAGGGGRGMRLVEHENQLSGALSTARSEALNAFGSQELILEKAIIEPRHVEIQVFADRHGNCIYLGERDCSVQRRHQKVIEEAPCPALSGEQRAEMGAAAIKVAESIAYVGAGTVEFLLDDSGGFYFLEMNTRLQVEHPVTEMITGLDLVALQIRVATGEPLGLSQSDLALDGHAIEARLYAEDPDSDFLPQAGRIEIWHAPEGTGIRVDAGVDDGTEISPFYDPMIAKIVAHGPDRETARRTLVSALKDTAAFGITTNSTFLIDCLEHKDFADGEATTGFVERLLSDQRGATGEDGLQDGAIAAMLVFARERDRALARSLGISPQLLGWSSNGLAGSTLHLATDNGTYEFHVAPKGSNAFQVGVEGASFAVTELRRGGHELILDIDGKRTRALHHSDGNRLFLSIDGRISIWRDLSGLSTSDSEDDGAGGQVRAPMHGRIVALNVQDGAPVNPGDTLAVLEAMKMQHQITSSVSGVVSSIHAEEGAQVAAGDLMIEIAVDEEQPPSGEQ